MNEMSGVENPKLLHTASSIRPFIGAKDFQLSRKFYCDLGFEEVQIGPDMSLFRTGKLGFYLQDFAVKEWLENTMVFLEVDDVDRYYKDLEALNLIEQYPTTKLMPIREEEWGKECFLIDPAGVLWHFGQFNKPA